MRYFALIVLLLSTSLWAAPEFPALSGRVVDEAGLLTPAQTQSLQDTLASYTRDNAWAEFNEVSHGRLKTGMAADVVVLSHDLTRLQPEDITTSQAMTTIKEGTVTFQRDCRTFVEVPKRKNF